MIHVHLDLTRDGTALVGQIGLADGQLRPFVGWLGLNAAIEELLEQDADRDDGAAGRTPPPTTGGGTVGYEGLR